MNHNGLSFKVDSRCRSEDGRGCDMAKIEICRYQVTAFGGDGCNL